MTPNFPYMPLQGRRIKGLDLLADYLWPSKPHSTAPSSAVAQNISDEDLSMSTSPVIQSVNDTSAENVTAPANTTTTVPAPEKSVPPTEFMVFMGDFIYADVPIYFGDDAEAYRRLYRRNYNSPSFRKVYERLRECIRSQSSRQATEKLSSHQQSFTPTTIMKYVLRIPFVSMQSTDTLR